MPAQRERIHLRYTLTFTAPFHCGTGLRAGLIHRTVQRDADGWLVIPGSTIKGVVRDGCERVARLFDLEVSNPHAPRDLEEFKPPASPLVALFGSRTRPGTLFFDDATLTEEWRALFQDERDSQRTPTFQRWQVQERTQVSLGRLTRTAQPGRLFTSEHGIPGLTFEGEIAGVITDYSTEVGKPSLALILLLAGLQLVDCLGGNRSAGAGRCWLEIGSLTVNGKPHDPSVLLADLGDLEVYSLSKE